MTQKEKLEELKQSAKYFFDLGIKVSRMITILDRGIAEEFILDLKRLENDYMRLKKRYRKESKL